MLSTGKVALVTGGGRGIGAAIARRLARDGLRIALMGRTRADLDVVAAEVGGRAIALDVTHRETVVAALATIEADLGPIDILVNNAGIATSAPLAKVTDEDWANTLAVNVTAPFVLARALIPGMVKRGWGRVIMVASNAGLTGYAYTSAYCAAKHAVVGLTRALAAEFARTAVTVNAVCPGFVDTEMTDRAVKRIAEATKRSEQESRAMLEAQSPQRRLVTPDEVAHAVAMLIPDEARGIHGQTIAIDGGQVMK